eukprot:3351192-Pyramimonas_sp.AAC.1
MLDGKKNRLAAHSYNPRLTNSMPHQLHDNWRKLSCTPRIPQDPGCTGVQTRAICQLCIPEGLVFLYLHLRMEH